MPRSGLGYRIPVIDCVDGALAVGDVFVSGGIPEFGKLLLSLVSAVRSAAVPIDADGVLEIMGDGGHRLNDGCGLCFVVALKDISWYRDVSLKKNKNFAFDLLGYSK